MSEVGSISESLEDYLEIIFHLVAEKRVARVKDIAARKNVRMASVTSALKRLAKEGYVHYSAREFVELSEKGSSAARKIVHRHTFLYRFLRDVLLLDDAQANQDACSIEHHLSSEALERFASFYQFATDDSLPASSVIKQFEDYCCRADWNIKPPAAHLPESDNDLQRLSACRAGQTVRVERIQAGHKKRQELVELGLLPQLEIRVLLIDAAANTVLLELSGGQLAVSLQDAQIIYVSPVNAANKDNRLW